MRWPGSTWPLRPGPCTGCSGRTARARPRRCGSWPPCWPPTAARPGCWAMTSPPSARGAPPDRPGRPVRHRGRGPDRRENLVLLGRLAGLARRGRQDPRRRSSWPLSGSGSPRRRQVKTYSGGMRRRLDLAASLIVRADLYFLDEPTTGLDPASRAQVPGASSAAIAAGGATVLLTTQYLRRGRPARRPDRGDRPRHGHRRGDNRRAQGIGRAREPCASGSPTPHAGRGARQMLTRLLGVTVQPDADPVALTARIPAGPATPAPASRRRRDHRACPRGHRHRRVRPRPAQPRRSVPHPHRPPPASAVTATQETTS